MARKMRENGLTRLFGQVGGGNNDEMARDTSETAVDAKPEKE